MGSKLLDEKLQYFRNRVSAVVNDLLSLTEQVGTDSLSDTVREIRDRINDPFLFVIVGEVKAGKSSFINALLKTGQEVCKVAPDPCTDTVQQVVYGDSRREFQISQYLKKITLPVEILREIAIVDTPGTNTIIEHHQDITEKFIPGSDLVVFVFEAKNPYRQSAWEFFNFIHADWRKKIIFILQQKDLLSPDDLKVNEKGVVSNAIKKGVEAPVVFSVSAKDELEGRESSSGFDRVRTYIYDHITGKDANLLKLRSNLGTARNISNRIGEGIRARLAQLEADQKFRKEVDEGLQEQESISYRKVGNLTEALLIEYDKSTRNTVTELRQGLGFFTLAKKSILAIFSREVSAQEWLSGLIKRLESDLTIRFNEKLNDGVDDIAHSVRQMASIIDLKLKDSQKMQGAAMELFGDISEKRATVIKELRGNFSAFMNKTENFVDSEVFPEASGFAPNIAAGGGLAVIGVVLAAVAHGAVFDVTGGILSSIGLLFAGITVFLGRRKILNAFQKEIATGRSQLESEISEKLKTYVANIRSRISGQFEEFDRLIAAEAEATGRLTGMLSDLEGQMKEIEKELK
jgi:GTP-binding protein EngB required for normal cell division